MASILEEKERNVIPRWRNSLIAFTTKEFSSLEKNTLDLRSDKFLLEKKNVWETDRDESAAIELIYSGFILHEFEIAKQAAEFLLKNSSQLSQPILEIATSIVHGEKKSLIFLSPSTLFDPTVKYHRIRVLKNKLKEDPRNAIARIDIAREYTINGQYEKALNNIKIALDLNIYNRFIIRSVVRFFIHIGKPDFASFILNRLETTKQDPWLLAASLGTSAVLKKPSKLYKDAVSLLEKKNLPDFHLTELAASLGAHEFYFGNLKKAKKFFHKSMSNPNENAIAQLIWTYNQLGIKDYNLEGLDVLRLNEALARDKFTKGDWKDSLDETIRWFNDQPFSRGPAYFGSYLASGILEDYNTAIKLCEISLEANPNDFTLLNNISFSLASSGNPINAQEYFNKINPNDLQPTQKVVYNATKGLIEFRRKNFNEGQYYYKLALDIASKNKFDKYLLSASLYLFREQMIAGISSDISLENILSKHIKNIEGPEQLEINKRIENLKKFVK